MTLRDLVLLHVAAVLSLRWLATAGASGTGSLLLWVLAGLLFFIPQGLAVSDLSSRYPEEGGIYFWTKRAFGEGHGFLCGWCYWVNNLLYYPNLLISTAVIATYVIGQGQGLLADDPTYVFTATLIMLWFAVGLNMVGLGAAKWLQNIGAFGTYIPGLGLIVLAVIALFKGPPANAFTVRTLVPDLSNFGELNLWASIAFAFAGLELAATMGGEIADPRRNLPRSILVAAPLVAFLYIVGTWAVLVLVPSKDVNIVSGFLQAIHVGAGAVGWVAPIAAAAYVLSNLGGVSAWLAGPARVAFTIGLDRYFPPAFGRIHPRWKTPYVAILVQGIFATLFLILSVIGRGTTVQKAYLILLDTMLLVYFIPYIYLFLTFLRVRARDPQGEGGAIPPKTRVGAWGVGIAGLFLTLFAMVVASIPPSDTAEPWLFELKVVGGAALFVLVGGMFYWRAKLKAPARAVARVLPLVAGLLLISTPGLVAQRDTVLKQIKIPHYYYFHEMYLPQATSGPSSLAWSPDGRELVYSMQGTLWRQRLGSNEARQLTDGPGYDYQPDWSPDGRFLLYSSYHDDAIELRLLDLTTGKPRSLLADGAVNLEPRWSPDGRRVAFVSSAYEGRWHVFVGEFADGALRGVQRVTEDVDSKLPRYYYSRYDHYLSPTWSPDGKELLLVSNRGRIWGTGGFWRMEARAGGPMRELRYEETNWQARPDWSRDGHRVVYSSYLGAQWHQLWLMTAEGGDPIQLTYGDFDATSPRWSPDGGRIAYISNEQGNTALWTVEIPGGHREPVSIARRTYLAARARLRLTVLDARSGKAIPARVSIMGPDGRYFAPDDAWRHADEMFDRSERKFEYGYFHTPGSSELAVPPGRVTIEVTRGPEYRLYREVVSLRPGATQAVQVHLERLDDLAAKGWYSGDLHIHMNYGGHYRNTPAHLVFQSRAEDLHVAENLIVTKEGRVPDIGYFTGRPDAASTPETIIANDQEFHTNYWGHSGLLGLTRNILIPAAAAYANTPGASPFPTNAVVFDLGHAQGAVTGYVHPFDAVPDPGDSSQKLTREFPVDLALGKVDYYEALGFVDSHWATWTVWYRALNAGFRLPAGAGTDAMANYAILRGPVGMNRVYVRVPGKLTHRGFLDGLKAGRTFVTNGPLLEFTLNGLGAGREIRLPEGRHQLQARVSLRSFVGVDHLEIVRNGVVVRDLPLGGDRTRALESLTLPVQESGWYLLRAYGDKARHPVLDWYPAATTSPIYVSVGGRPVRSPDDLAYFIAWIKRLESVAAANPEWNSEVEKEEALRSFRAAREELERRAGGSNE